MRVACIRQHATTAEKLEGIPRGVDADRLFLFLSVPSHLVRTSEKYNVESIAKTKDLYHAPSTRQ